jgi:phage-related protein
VLHAFEKMAQETAQRDIDLATARLKVEIDVRSTA